MCINCRSLSVERGSIMTYLICITILKFNVYLICGQVHERELKEWFFTNSSDIVILEKHTTCSFLPTPMMKTFPPNCIDCTVSWLENVNRLWRTDIDGGVNAAFDTCTLQGDSQGTTRCFLDLSSLFFGGGITRNQDSAYTGDQLFCKVQTVLEKISDDNRLRSSSPSRK